ncbi:hypothetical protein [Capnocytophaga sp. oral taxon 326]|jgi:hypothetical protein|uniref:hypothetical protein n=2 Tax=Flavobacteriaceae TaxID=49546 RepID=UPI0002A45A03|nr:hypothetical protein [Capnocytophaga sp. oral taxon 326]EKY22032.1 hypothetical protein HMPREF9073_00275 [Capnocytophaga sp. oral taxon 326 str. F0382]
MGLFSSILKGTGFSFSWKRAVGLTALRSKASRRIGVPTSRQGVERKIGATLLGALFGTSKKKGRKKKGLF